MADYGEQIRKHVLGSDTVRNAVRKRFGDGGLAETVSEEIVREFSERLRLWVEAKRLQSEKEITAYIRNVLVKEVLQYIMEH